MASTGALFDAIDAGDVDGVRAILAADPAAAAIRDAQGISPLMRARYRLDGGLVQAILAVQTELDVFEAAAFGELDRLAELLGTDPSLATTRSGDGFTPLHLAAFFGRSEATELLLARGAEVDALGTGWMTGTALHSAASGRHRDVIALLLEAGADPDVRQSHGWTALHAAAQHGDADIVELLLARGADRDARNDDGIRPAELARRAGHAAIADLLDQVP
jgi:uncharacterized protein